MRDSTSLPWWGRFLVVLLGEHRGWIRCPSHGYTYQPELRGFHGSFYYRRCPSQGCEYSVDTEA